MHCLDYLTAPHMIGIPDVLELNIHFLIGEAVFVVSRRPSTEFARPMDAAA